MTALERPARGRTRRGERAEDAPRLDVDALLDDPNTRVVVCCGSGGVGKTTTAAALALRAAERGRTVAVLTIDPARRLAQSLGLGALDNTPREVTGIDSSSGGALDAMMLDMKRTFDEVVSAHSSPAKAQQIFDNPFYQALSSSFAGTQEYMAMEKLGQLRAQRRPDDAPRWDLIVVDTPPSRSALDFLDAPARLGSFLDGRFIRMLTAPAKAGGRAYLKVVGAGVTIATTAMAKVLGAQLLEDVRTLVAALDTMFGGFRERADQTYALLQQPETAFLVVAAPERDALREAGYFVDRLRADDMPLAGVVVNRMATVAVPGISGARADEAAAEQESQGGAGEPPFHGSGDLEERGNLGDRAGGEDGGPADALLAEVTAGTLRIHAALAELATRHEALTRRFIDRQPGVPLMRVAAEAQDVHDIGGLRRIGAALAGG